MPSTRGVTAAGSAAGPDRAGRDYHAAVVFGRLLCGLDLPDGTWPGGAAATRKD